MVDPITLAAVGSAVANIGSSLLGDWLAGADEKQKRALEEEAYRLYGDISAPTLEKVLAEKVGPSAMEGLPKDFGNKSARNLALQRIMEMGLSGGNDPESQLALEEGRRAAAAYDQQTQGAIRAGFQRRGLGGAGEAVAAQVAQQQGADRMARSGLEAAADKRSRALAALAQSGAMAGQFEGQDFQQAAQVADARDRIAQFNANLAQQTNLYNSGLQQQDFNNRMGVADRQYQAKMEQAGTYGQRADKKRKQIGGVGQSLGFAGGALGQYMGGAPASGYGQMQPAAPMEYDPNDPRRRR